MTLFVLMAALASTLSLALVRSAGAKTAKEVDEAYSIAEAGVARSLYEMQLGIDYGGDGIGNSNGAAGTGTFAANVAPPFAGAGEYTISSISTVRGLRRGVSAIVRRLNNGVGFFANNSITQTGGMIDSYDSSLGTYASQVGALGHAGTGGNIGSNGNIALSGSATIWGNATPGPLSSVTGTVSGVHGSTAPAATPTILAPYVYAPTIPSAGSISGSLNLTSGTYRYTQIAIGGGKVLKFSGNVTLYVDSKLTISGSGYATLAPGAKVTIHHGSNDLTFSGGGVINQDKQPANLKIYSASLTKVTVSGSAEFFGVIHAPHAQFVDSGSAGYFGAISAKSITLSGGGNLHYDAALAGGVPGFQLILRRKFPV
jgi:hypothetical protein